MIDYFDPKLALDNNTGTAVSNAVAEVFSATDTSFSTPLAITDPTGVPMPVLKASPTGIYPAFKVVSGETQVLVRSGNLVTPMSSLYGIFLDMGLDPETVSRVLATAQTVEGLASTASTDASNAAESALQAQAAAERAESVPNTSDAVMAPILADSSTASGSFVRAAFVPKRSALDIMAAHLSKSITAPVAVVVAGSSSAAGVGASTPSNSWVSVLVNGLQRTYSAGNLEATQFSPAAAFTALTSPGVHGYSAGEGNTQADTYLTDAESALIAALKPAVIFHMVGSNDYAAQKNPATYAAQVAARISYLDSVLTMPAVHVLIHAFQRMGFTPSTYQWAAYGSALRGVAEADPARRVFVDLAAPFAAAGVPGSDPLDLLGPDDVHMTDDGHAFAANLIGRAVGTSILVPPKSKQEPAPLSSRTFSDGFSANGPWNNTYTADLLLGGSAKALANTTSQFEASGGILRLAEAGTTAYQGFAIPTNVDFQIAFDLTATLTAGNWWIGLFGALTGAPDRLAIQLGTTNRVFASTRVAGATALPFSTDTGTGVGRRFALRRYRGRYSLLVDGAIVFSAPVPAGMGALGFFGMSCSGGKGGGIDNLAVDILS